MNRKYIYYELETLEPLIIGDNSQIGNLVKTKDYIPGNTILGLFAALYLRKNKTPHKNSPENCYNDDFAGLFLSDSVHFHNAYPVHEDVKNKTFPMPMSIFGCKYFGGNTYNSQEKQHGLVDKVFETLPHNYCCNAKRCNCEMMHRDGYLYFYEGMLMNLFVKKRIDAHVNVDDEQLYSFEAIEKNTHFYGYIGICENDFEKYSDLLKELAEVNLFLPSDYPFRIGKAKNRGHGLVRLNDFREAEYPFNRTLSLNAVNSVTLLSVYCYSDIILKNSWGQSYTWLDPAFINKDLKLMEDLSYWQFGEYRGFNAKKRMPQGKEIIIKKGSVFVFGTANQDLDLTDLPVSIGELQNAGFGKLIYNHKEIGKQQL